MAMTEEELNGLRELLAAYKQQKGAKSSVRKRKKAIASQEDYESMTLAEFSGQINDSMGDCTELAVNEFFAMSRANRKGRKIEAVGHGIKGSIGVGLVAYGLYEIFSAAIGKD
jgi:hypothetical protein